MTTSEPTKPTLPIIDISSFLEPITTTSPPSPTLSARRSQTISSLSHACREYGFFYLTGHGIDAETRQSILSAARTFFTTAPPADKAAIRRQDPGRGIGDGARGYQVLAENVTQGKRDWHEAIDWYREIEQGEGVEAADLVEVAHSDDDPNLVLTLNPSSSSTSSSSRTPPYPLLHGLNLWPSHPPNFRTLYTAYITQLRAVGRAVLLAMGRALSLSNPDVLADATLDSFWVMRAIGYPPLDAELAAQGGVSCGQHTDYGCLTLLLADETKGALQVLRRRPVSAASTAPGEARDDGRTGRAEEEEEEEEWISADPIPGAYVVNVGDMVELWTAGLVRSTVHRVVHTGGNYRVSVPFFLEPGLDVVVEPLAECVQRRRELVRAEGGGGAGGGEADVDVGRAVRYGDHLAKKVGGNFYGGGGGQS